jgi:hypothetical protein
MHCSVKYFLFTFLHVYNLSEMHVLFEAKIERNAKEVYFSNYSQLSSVYSHGFVPIIAIANLYNLCGYLYS